MFFVKLVYYYENKIILIIQNSLASFSVGYGSA